MINMERYIHTFMCYLAFVGVVLPLSLSPLEDSYTNLFSKYCPYTNQCSRNATKPVPDGLIDRVPCCLPCRCDRYCNIRQDCCPDAEKQDDDTDNLRACVETRLPYHRTETLSYLMIAKCPPGTADDLAANCSRNINFRTSLVVSDVKTGTIYRNEFCAICNGFNNTFVRWKAVIECPIDTFMIRNLNSLDSIYDMISGTFSPRSCYLDFQPPDGTMLYKERCRSRIIENGISGCADNSYDKILQHRCDVTSPSVVYFKRKKSIFRTHEAVSNLFCGLCSRNVLWPHEELCPVDILFFFTPRWYKSFSAIINLDAASLELASRPHLAYSPTLPCGQREIFDRHKQECRSLLCPSGYQPNQGQCKALYETLFISVYKLTLVFRDPSKEKLDIPTTEDVKRALDQYVGTYTNFTCDYILKSAFVPLEGLKMIYKQVLLFDYFVGIPGNFSNEDKMKLFKTFNRREHFLDIAVRGSLNSYHTWQVTQLSPDLELSNITVIEQEGNNCHRSSRYNKVLFCPHVLLSSSEVYYNNTLFLPFTNKRLYFYEYMTSSNNSFLVCIEDYFSNSKQADSVFPLARNGLSITSYICTLFSMSCLAVLITTYMIFATLRNTFGKLLIVLSFNLLLAQATFQFGADKTDNAVVCTVAGAMIHFFWLSAFSSMSVCLFYIYRATTSMEDIREDRSLPLASLLSVYLPPCAIVIVYAIYSESLEGFQPGDFGYGGQLCFINSNRMYWPFFLCPIIFAIVINSALCGMSLLNVHVTTSALWPVKSLLKRYSLICMRLSLFTGTFWAFGFLYRMTDSKIFEYIFVILNCNLGFLLFLAFIAKPRVVRLYSSLFRNISTENDVQIGNVNSSSMTTVATLSRSHSETNY